MKYLINLSYDGSKFYGFQKQKRWDTIQGEIEKALSQMFNKKIQTIGASRTDKGVHAYNQYLHFIGPEINDFNKFLNSINKMINKSIYVKKLYKVNNDFSARYDVKNKEYVYKINPFNYNPMEKDYVLQYNKYIDIHLLKKAAKKLKGKHNFKAFTSDHDKDDYVREIKSIKIVWRGDYIYIYIKTKSFLRYMIRNIVGLLLEINEGKKSIKDIDKIFASEDRSENAKCVDGCGLYLNRIWY